MAVPREGTRSPVGSSEPGQQSTGTAADSLVNRLQRRVVKDLNERKDRVSQTVDSVVDTVRRMSEPLRDQPYPGLSDAATVAVDRMEQFATALRDRKVEDVPEDLRRFARTSPAAYLGVGLAAGILAGRFLKSSAGHSDPQSSTATPATPGARASQGVRPGRGTRNPLTQSSQRTSAVGAEGAWHGKEQG